MAQRRIDLNLILSPFILTMPNSSVWLYGRFLITEPINETRSPTDCTHRVDSEPELNRLHPWPHTSRLVCQITFKWQTNPPTYQGFAEKTLTLCLRSVCGSTVVTQPGVLRRHTEWHTYQHQHGQTKEQTVSSLPAVINKSFYFIPT